MENVIYKYPQSSCDCFDCKKNLSNVEISTDQNHQNFTYSTSNLSVKSCGPFTSQYSSDPLRNRFKCYNYEVSQEKTLPMEKSGFTNLNPNMGLSFSPDFTSVDCASDSFCPGTTYVSKDPRLMDPRRAMQMQLDRPAYVGNIPLDDIYDQKFKNYGKNYTDYSSINAGSINYYTDKSLDGPFFDPNFTIPAYETGIVYQDPMSNINGMYSYTPKTPFNPMERTQEQMTEYGCLSFLNDTGYQREDIMSKQMSTINKQRYQTRWEN
jgi:hypothetical protein